MSVYRRKKGCNLILNYNKIRFLTHPPRITTEQPYLTMYTILPDRGITKIAETVLVSAICGILSICSVIRLGLEPRTPTLKVLCSTC